MAQMKPLLDPFKDVLEMNGAALLEFTFATEY